MADLDTQVKHGERAEQLLKDEVLLAAFARADAQFVTEWRHAKTASDRESAHAKQAALAEVQAQLFAIKGNGTVAAAHVRRTSR